jgi:hypothetical protein
MVHPVMLMKNFSLLLATWFAAVGSVSAADGSAPEWTDVAQADRTLMGDYQGEWLDAPRGHYFEINKPLAVQVINVRSGEYLLRFYQEHDRRADPYFEGTGRLEGDEIRFTANGWSGAVSKDGLSGTGNGHGGGAGRFHLKKVTRSSPTLGMAPPPGAVVLFDGRDFRHWQHGDGREVTWLLPGNGAMEVRRARNDEDRKNRIGGDIQTRETFGDCRVHLEFRYPVEPGRSGQGRGNSGFFLQGDYEVQILNSYGLHGWWNECGALYKASPPQVNAARPPMEWQTYDVEYTASVWKDGRKVSPPRITVRHNGVLIHKDEEIPHATSHTFAGRLAEPKGPGPLRLQDHGNAIQFRNIWAVPGGAR